MIDSKKLAELRKERREFPRLPTGQLFDECLDTLEALWKENAEFRSRHDELIKRSILLERVASAAEISLPSKDLFEPHEGIKRLREALAALRQGEG